MARKFLTAIDLAKNELQNAAVQSLGSAPATPVKFQLYGNTSDNTLYWWNGASWVSAAGGGTGFPGYGAVLAETTFGLAKSDGVATTTARSDHTHGSPTHNNAAHSTINLNALAVPTGDVSMSGFKITNLAQPTGPDDAVPRSYVQNYVNGISWKPAVRVATTANITLSGLQTIDGVALVAYEKVLVKNQTNQAQNGLYEADTGTWYRMGHMNTESEVPGAAVYVTGGTTHQDTAWTVSSPDTIVGFTLETTPIIWSQFAGPGTVTGGSGLTQSGNVLNVGAGTGITVAADTVALDTTYADGRYALLASGAKRFSASVGGSTSQAVAHNLNTRDVVVNVYRVAAPYDSVECDVERTDVNNVTLRFAVAPAASEYRAVVLA